LVGATFQPFAAFAQGGVPMIEKTTLMLFSTANRTVRSYVSQL